MPGAFLFVNLCWVIWREQPKENDMSFRGPVSEMSEEQRDVSYCPPEELVGTYVTEEERFALIDKDVSQRTGVDVDVVSKVRDALKRYNHMPF